MLDQTPTGYRTRIRAATQEAHAALDGQISDLSLEKQRDFAVFCMCHAVAFGAMRPASGDEALSSLLTDLQNRLNDDLETLGHAPARPARAIPLCDIAIRYILHGSRLGTKVLRKRWLQSDDPRVRAASRYMSAPVSGAAWKQTCADLDRISPQSTEARTIEADAVASFKLFETALREAALMIPG